MERVKSRINTRDKFQITKSKYQTESNSANANKNELNPNAKNISLGHLNFEVCLVFDICDLDF